MHRTPYDLHKSLTEEDSQGAVSFIGGGAYTAARGRDFPPHHHSVWEIVYYREGNIRCPVGERVYSGQPGVVLATPPGTVRSEEAVTAYANYFIQVAAPPEMPWPVHCRDDAAGTLAGVCRALVREGRSASPDSREMTGLLMRQLDLLLRRAALHQEEEPISDAERTVRAAERLFDERRADGVRVSEVARELGVSPATLRAYFATCRTYAPRDYALRSRAQAALSLLQTSSLTLEAIARLTGHDSASHLSRHLKQWTGRTPGALRRP